MNRKEAEKIIKHPEASGNDYELSRANGFLEGYAEAEKRAKILIHALEDCVCVDADGHSEAKQALEAYGREK